MWWKRRTQKPKPPELEWRESRTAKHRDELRYRGEVVATLDWEGLFSTLATGTSRAGQWTFERPLLLSRDIEIDRVSIPRGRASTPRSHVSIPEGTLFARFFPGWMYEGTLALADGREFHWRSGDFWQAEWSFVDDKNALLMRFYDTSGFLERRTAVGTYSTDLPDADRGFLVLLGHYLLTMQAHDNAAVAASAAATAACC